MAVTKRILVTGGCGFLGSNLCKRLVAEGHEVTSLDNGSRGNRKVDGVHYETGDVRERWWTVQHTVQFDTVFHLAAINGTKHFYERPEEVLDVQIRGTLNVLDACKANGVKELILFSSSEVYGQADQIPTPETVPLKIADPFNPRFSYAAGKIAAEMMCLHARHLDRVLVIRPHNVYGPDMGYDHVIPELIAKIERGAVVNVPPHSRAFCYVSDFISGVMTAWATPYDRQIFHVGTRDEIAIPELLEHICRAMGKDFASVYEAGHDYPWHTGSPEMRCPDSEKLRRLGWWPRVALPDGLKETVDWYLSVKSKP